MGKVIEMEVLNSVSQSYLPVIDAMMFSKR
jgi:hypothetical protein